MSRAICAAVAVLALLVASPAPATAVHGESQGCQLINSPTFDGFYQAAGIAPAQFFAGERITVSATTPTVGAPIAVQLEVPTSTVVATSGFPGEVSYTFPALATTTVAWRTSPEAGVTWTVTCQRAVHDGGYPLAVSPARPATEIAAPAAVAVESGERTAFPLAAVGIGALAVLVQIGLWRGATRRRRLVG